MRLSKLLTKEKGAWNLVGGGLLQGFVFSTVKTWSPGVFGAALLGRQEEARPELRPFVAWIHKPDSVFWPSLGSPTAMSTAFSSPGSQVFAPRTSRWTITSACAQGRHGHDRSSSMTASAASLAKLGRTSAP